MQVEFDENIKDDIKDLICSITNNFIKINTSKYIKSFNNLNLRITSKVGFQCEIAFNQTILLSQNTIEIIWCLAYAHLIYYKIFCKGIKPDGQELQLKNDEWVIPKDMLIDATNSLCKKEENLTFLDSYSRDFSDSNDFGCIFKYALMFFISHELFHVNHKNRFLESLDEENQCDIDAIKLILNSFDDVDYINKSKGVCIGLMILNIYGIHTNNYDGKSHPYTYNRLINNLELFFGKENDKIWGFAVAIFALHMTQKNIKQPKYEFDNFYDCVIEYKRMLENNNVCR